MKKVVTKYVLIFLFFLILYLIISPVRGIYVDIGPFGGIILSSIIYFISYFLFTFYFLRKNNKNGDKHASLFTMAATIAGGIFVDVLLYLYLDNLHPLFFIEFCFIVSGIFAGYVLYRIPTRKLRLLLGTVTIIAIPFLSLYISTQTLHKASFGTFSGRVEPVESEIFLENESGDTISIKQFKGGYLVLDFWATWCGVCYRKFPEVQQLHDSYKDSPIVKIFAVLDCTEDDGMEASVGGEIIRKRGFTFPCLSIKDSTTLNSFGIKSYPTVLVFNRAGTLIFRGDIKKATKLIEDLTHSK